jgi:PPK2 family polyphosphate:nucleotide phosphotransferase
MINLFRTATTPPKDFTKKDCLNKLADIRKELFELQNDLFAQKKKSILIIFQGVDTAGKDSTIRRVFSSMNPMGIKVKAFKEPTEEEMMHDFMWRIFPNFPEKGCIQIFNRSHYEDIIMPQILGTNFDLVSRMEYIRQTEDHLHRHGTLILKFFLHVSVEEQNIRIQERKTDPKKKYKYSPEDELAAEKYPLYQSHYNAILNAETNYPWHIIPADKKWYRNYLVAKEFKRVIKEALQ